MTVTFQSSDDPPVPVRDAATVVLVRDRSDGQMEVLFVKRRADIRFMGGAYVFPGGKLDPGDFLLATDEACNAGAAALAIGWPEDDTNKIHALHVAALRECVEEAGILLCDPPAQFEQTLRVRDGRNNASTPFDALLGAEGLRLDVRALRPLARWITPREENRRYDTRFFVAACAPGTVAVHDDGETVDSAWLTPHAAIEMARAGTIVLAPPTWSTVATLAGFADTATLLAHTSAPIAEGVMPRVLWDDEGILVAVPGDGEHPQSLPVWFEQARARAGALWPSRFRYANGGWQVVA